MSDKGAGGEEVRYPRRFVWDGYVPPGEYIEQLGPNGKCVCVAPGRDYHGVSWGAEAAEKYTASGLWIETFDHHPMNEQEPKGCPTPGYCSAIDAVNENAKLRAEVERLTKALKTKQMEIDLHGEPAVIDEARWLEERNAGAESFAKKIIEDDGRGTLNEGPCREAIEIVRGLRKERDALSALLQGNAERVRTLEQDIEQIGNALTLPPDCDAGRILSEIEHVREKARDSKGVALAAVVADIAKDAVCAADQLMHELKAREA